jgi:hypothetical protein
MVLWVRIRLRRAIDSSLLATRVAAWGILPAGPVGASFGTPAARGPGGPAGRGPRFTIRHGWGVPLRGPPFALASPVATRSAGAPGLPGPPAVPDERFTR